MIIYMDRGLCDADLSFCGRCSATFFQKPLGTDRPCVTKIVDDGDDVVRSDGELGVGRHEVAARGPQGPVGPICQKLSDVAMRMIRSSGTPTFFQISAASSSV